MSKGWESKGTEEQQAEAERRAEASPAGSSGPASSSSISASEARNAELARAEAERRRRVQSLELQRERVLSERTSNPHRRSALELALATIERELEQLGWSIKI
ncbi:MAG: hypothetical protein ACLGQX_09160 [Acidobacteriota bacterium]